MKGYRHIDEMERERIAVMVHGGERVATIARALGRASSSITRELARNRGCDASGQAGYFACHAQRQASCRAQRARRPRVLVPGSRLWQPVMSKLRRGGSPEQIAQRLSMQYPDEPERWVSHQTIYHALEVLPRGELKAELKRHLRRQGKPAKGAVSSLLGASIHQRPREAADRRVPGHWEGDLMVGQGNRSAVGVMVERHTRYLILVQLDRKDAFSVYQGFARKLKPVPAIFRQTLTYDRGREMAEHERLTRKVGIKVYFGDPHSPWQRGSCENTNGLLRQYLPKSTDLSPFSQRTLNAIADRLNTRPRKTLGWYTPKEVYTRLLNEYNMNYHAIHSLHLEL
jgi:transposase, IS30 family